MKGKKTIRGFAKTAGRYTLKGLGKGLELAGRGSIKTVNALVQNRGIQKIATGAGILAASVMIPTIGVGLVSAVGLKYLMDKTVNGKDKAILNEIGDILNAGNKITKSVSDKVLSPVLRTMNDGVKSLGKKYQDKVDDVLR